jgi:HSP20 family molecular chaperone IbpA
VIWTGKSTGTSRTSGAASAPSLGENAGSRAFTLPGEVDEAKIAATFKDGVMTIDLPKSTSAQKKAKKITIQRGK